MDKEQPHTEIARGLAQKVAEKASEQELRISYEEMIFQHLMNMNTEEFNQVLWHG